MGVHPTPLEMVAEFASITASALKDGINPGETIRVLDACAGDGRLGRAVCSELKKLGYMPRLVMLDTRDAVMPGSGCDYYEEYLIGNIFNVDIADGFDLVVSNPPYEHLNVERARQLGLDWRSVRAGGRNLYGMVMLACLDLCKPGGLCSFIAPQGWLRNVLSKELRGLVSSRVSAMRVWAFQNRRIFPNVVQDTSIQLMRVRVSAEPRQMLITISYDRAAEEDLVLPLVNDEANVDLPRVRIGPLVWNRHDDSLFVDKGGYRVLYGGNISTDGCFSWLNPKYFGRRRVVKSSVARAYVSKAPYIGIKRVMRGGPGAWKADLAAELTPGQECVAENHVIVVELPGSVTSAGVEAAIGFLKVELERRHRDHGHPNLSVGVVRDAVAAFPIDDWVS